MNDARSGHSSASETDGGFVPHPADASLKCATSPAFVRLLLSPSRAYATRRLPFRLHQFCREQTNAVCARPMRPAGGRSGWAYP